MSYYFSKIDKNISRIVYGCSNEIMLAGEDASFILDEALQLGVNTFDTAENYKLSEISLGNWLVHQKRDDLVIITKGCHPYNDIDRVTPEHIEEDLKKSLQQLKTDYIDIYFLHRDDFKVPVGPLVEKLNELKQKGIIRAFGGSNWTMERINAANDYAIQHELEPFTVSSPNFSLAEQKEDPWGGGEGSVSIGGPKNEAVRAWYKEKNLLTFGFSSLARGLFGGKVNSSNIDHVTEIIDEAGQKGYLCPENLERLKRVEKLAHEKGYTIAQVTIAWILNQNEVNAFPIITTTNKDRLVSNVKAIDIKLTTEEINWLNLIDN